MNDYILTIACPDTTGIVHAVSGWLLNLQGNIVEAEQFGDAQTNNFFLRIHFSLPVASNTETLQADFAPIADQYNMDAHIYDPYKKARVLLLVSRQGHCLNDLLFRTRAGQLPIEIVGVISNHTDHAALTASYDTPFYHLPITAETKAKQEKEILKFVDELNVDLVVLARYMQILSPELCRALSGRAINIHHSFLPSFKGARPYHQAHVRGVKIIGATAHYVTEDLDEGPIIEQDIERVSHAMSPYELTQVGSDVESLVLSRAVKAHVEHRIFLNGQRTVVFK